MSDHTKHPDLPFPLSDVSNGEWCPRPPNQKQRQAAKLLLEEADIRAKRLGMSRRSFLRTAAGTATAFLVLNRVYGLPNSGEAAVLPVDEEKCQNLDAARELFKQQYFIMDVQLHHVDLDTFGDATALCFLRFLEPDLPCEQRLQNLGQLNFVKEVFVDSETAVGVISGVPDGIPLPVDAMAATRNLVNQLAGSPRALSQAMIDPRAPASSKLSIAQFERQVKELGAVALKCYTGRNNWFLDDEEVSYPMLEECTRLGLRLVNVHKGLPQILGPMAEPYVRSRDLPKVARDWPRLSFVAYHSGYFGEGITGIEEFLGVIRSMRPDTRRNVYAEIGSSFAIAFNQGPESAAHLVGSLLRELGDRHVIWGTDSIWWGSPQWQIQAFKALTIPPALQEQYGYPPLTERSKRRILGLNAARLYRVKVNETRYAIQSDNLAKIRERMGGIEQSRSYKTYGPRTRRDFFKLLAREKEMAEHGTA
jgi:uncharacterized protein